jgi:hypothetical protein
VLSSAFALPVRIKLSSCSRSAALSFTTYFFTAISLAATNQLRQNVAAPWIRRFYSLSMTGGTRIAVIAPVPLAGFTGKTRIRVNGAAPPHVGLAGKKSAVRNAAKSHQ